MKTVHRGRSRYIKVQGFVLPCTLMYRLHSGTQDFLVLPCTFMYLHVSSNGEGRNWCIGNQGKYWYILVHTSTYENIPGHTNTYQYILVHTSTYQDILMGDYVDWYIPVYGFDWWFYTSTYLHIPPHTCLYLIFHVHTSTYQYIPVLTSQYWNVLVMAL